MTRSAPFLSLFSALFLINCGQFSDSIQPEQRSQREQQIQPALRLRSVLPLHRSFTSKTQLEYCPDKSGRNAHELAVRNEIIDIQPRTIIEPREGMRTFSMKSMSATDLLRGAGEGIWRMTGNLPASVSPSSYGSVMVLQRSMRTIPAIERLSISSEPRFESIYDYGEIVEIVSVFDEAVEITGLPYLVLELHSSGSQRAFYQRGSGSKRLYFRYRVNKKDWDRSGICVYAGQVYLNGGSIHAVSDGAKARLRHTGLPDDPDHRVNGSVGG